jgi:hypothetical protein
MRTALVEAIDQQSVLENEISVANKGIEVRLL